MYDDLNPKRQGARLEEQQLDGRRGLRLASEKAQKRFYDLVWPHAATVQRTARILTSNVAEAEDLAQETMLKAFKAIESFQAGTDARAWLLAILRNARIDRLRCGAAAAGNVSLESLPLEPADESLLEGTEQPEWQKPQEILNAFADQEIIDVMQELPEEIRWTLLLVDVEGLDHREAAEILAVPVGTVKSRVHRGRAMLRAALLPLARDRRLLK